MSDDNKRFVDVTELARHLKIADVNKAIDIATKADAIMRIGIKVWYDWKKAVEWYELNNKVNREDINWFGKGKYGGDNHSYRKNSNYVSLTTNAIKDKYKLRISIPKNAINKELDIYTDKIMVGSYDNRLYITFSKKDGFALEKGCKTRYASTVLTITNKTEVESYLGFYELHQEADDLWYIDTDEKM